MIGGVRSCAGVLICLGSWSLFVAMTSSSASASTLGGTATISAPGNTLPLTGTQGSETFFTVNLPSGAACSGDTASDGYHEYSYLVPSGTAVTSLTFSSGFASNNLGLVESDGTPWDGIDTNPVNGLIIGIASNYEWAPLVTDDGLSLTGSSGLLYSGSTGVWEAGIACATSAGVLSDNWNTEVTFTAAGNDPNGFVWSAVPGVTTTSTTAPTSSTTSSSTTPTTTPTSTTPTTTPGSTSTTAAGSTTTAAASSSASSGSSGSGGSGTGVTSASGGSLAFTGGMVVRDMAIGLLCIGFGLILLGLSVKLRDDVAPALVLR